MRRLLTVGLLTPALLVGAGVADVGAPSPTAALPVAVEHEAVLHWVPRAVAPPVAPRPRPRPPVQPVRKVARAAGAQQPAPVVRRTKAQAFTRAQAAAVGREAFARVNHPLPPGWRIVFEVYRGSWQGLADTSTRQVTIWVRPSDTPARLQVTVAHELGHVLDYTTVTAQDRQRYLQLRGRADCRDPWYPRNGTSDYASPAGDFAEVYALWRGGRGDFRSRFAPAPSDLGPFVRFFAELEARQP